MTKTVEWSEAVAALCVYEEFLRYSRKDSDEDSPITELWEQVGAFEMRDLAINLGKRCEEVYALLTANDPDMLDGTAFDWEFVPHIMDLIDWESLNFYREDPGFPDAETLKAKYLLAHVGD